MNSALPCNQRDAIISVFGETFGGYSALWSDIIGKKKFKMRVVIIRFFILSQQISEATIFSYKWNIELYAIDNQIILWHMLLLLHWAETYSDRKNVQAVIFC